MHLKTLTLKGFKSFAAATTLRLEPGITCIVGPNGSGKSNVVDALTWVMGEQGAKTLRGGKMEDVIFAGTGGRAPLGRAEVSLTIDNADGALPVEYSEVTITRTMFRTGGSEYAINGSGCRLLDVQELLSDSGLGRQMHVVVGQGQLDAVLHAGPDERRALIEEAAGVLKHRRRRERAVRKLEGMQANVTRVSDLVEEIRRQLGPLGRQARVARRARTVQAELRDARLRLLADDLAQATAALDQHAVAHGDLERRRVETEQDLVAGEEELRVARVELARTEPATQEAADTWYRLSSVRERFAGTASLAAERLRLLAEDVETAGAGRGPGPEQLVEQARRARAQEAGLVEEVHRRQAEVERRVAQRRAAEQAVAEHGRRADAAQRAAADRREGLARLAGRVAAAASRLEARRAEVDRLLTARQDALARAESARADRAALESQVAGFESAEQGLDALFEAAQAELEQARARVGGLRAAGREAEQARAEWAARGEALRLAVSPADGTAAVLAAGDRLPGVLGRLTGLLRVDAGFETAIAAALSTAVDAVVVSGAGCATAAMAMLRADGAGRASLLLAEHRLPGCTAASGEARARPAVGVPAQDVVHAAPVLRSAMRRLLSDVVVVEDLDEAGVLASSGSTATAVTRDGDLLGPVRAEGGSSAASVLEVQAALAEAERRTTEAGSRGERLRVELAAADRAVTGLEQRAQARLDELHESDARFSAMAERLAQLGAAVRAARAEQQRSADALVVAERAVAAARSDHDELAQRLATAEHPEQAAAEAGPGGWSEENDRRAGDELAVAGNRAREAETQARLALRTAEERHAALSGRADQLDRAAAAEVAARRRQAERAAGRERRRRTAEAVQQVAAAALRELDTAVRRADQERHSAGQSSAALRERLARAEQRVRAGQEKLALLVDDVHRDDLVRAEQRLRVEQLQARGTEEFGMSAAELVEGYGPHRPVGDAGAAYVRAEQERRRRSAERDLSALGAVNPLALEEFAALEERHAFLVAQLADLTACRRDLLDIVREVDARVQSVFRDAFTDVAAAFEDVFARLFPGGEGRLVLTEPDDPGATGVEVEARPAGKRVKRLSLLSGGERSLTAVALLVAIFRARPSPFYVLDEVEAALDETNLGRLLGILEELRADSQLIVVTHQRRTMEIADALYGVSMRRDGITTVVSQRLRRSRPA